MTTRAVSIDLETLDTSATAAIVSIGAVVFDPHAQYFTVLNSFYVNCHIDGQERSISHSTLCWWMKQPDAIRAAFVEGAADLSEALVALDLFLTGENETEPLQLDEIWAKPAMFDISILEHAYSQCGMTVPWHYRTPRCLRTLQALYPKIDIGFEGDKHNALADALHQAKLIHTIMHARSLW